MRGLDTSLGTNIVVNVITAQLRVCNNQGVPNHCPLVSPWCLDVSDLHTRFLVVQHDAVLDLNGTNSIKLNTFVISPGKESLEDSRFFLSAAIVTSGIVGREHPQPVPAKRVSRIIREVS